MALLGPSRLQTSPGWQQRPSLPLKQGCPSAMQSFCGTQEPAEHKPANGQHCSPQYTPLVDSQRHWPCQQNCPAGHSTEQELLHFSICRRSRRLRRPASLFALESSTALETPNPDSSTPATTVRLLRNARANASKRLSSTPGPPSHFH